MQPHSLALRSDALRIWMAGLEAVRSERLMAEAVYVDGHTLIVGNDIRGCLEVALRIDLNSVNRVAVVGWKGRGGNGGGVGGNSRSLADGGKTTGRLGQCAGGLCAKSPHPAPATPARRENGPLTRASKGEGVPIHLHAARPAGVNEPTPEGARRGGRDSANCFVPSARRFCVALISGGGRRCCRRRSRAYRWPISWR